MIGEWIRFGLCAAFLLAGLFIMVVSITACMGFLVSAVAAAHTISPVSRIRRKVVIIWRPPPRPRCGIPRR